MSILCHGDFVMLMLALLTSIALWEWCGLETLKHVEYTDGTWPPPWSTDVSVSCALEKHLFSKALHSVPRVSTRSILLSALFRSSVP